MTFRSRCWGFHYFQFTQKLYYKCNAINDSVLFLLSTNALAFLSAVLGKRTSTVGVGWGFLSFHPPTIMTQPTPALITTSVHVLHVPQQTLIVPVTTHVATHQHVAVVLQPTIYIIHHQSLTCSLSYGCKVRNNNNNKVQSFYMH